MRLNKNCPVCNTPATLGTNLCNRCWARTDLDISVIPEGLYCGNCPYLIRLTIPENELDYHPGIVAMGQKHINWCELIQENDDTLEAKGMSLLWDGCKECGINMDREDDKTFGSQAD